MINIDENYVVSSTGKARSLDRLDSKGRFLKGKILSSKTNTHNYESVMIGKKRFYVHRLKRTCNIVLFLVCLLLLLSLIGCAKQNTPTNTVADSAKESINTIVAAKPECKDVGTVCNTQIESITATCDLEISNINKDLVKWKWSFFGLLITVIAYIIKKVLK